MGVRTMYLCAYSYPCALSIIVVKVKVMGLLIRSHSKGLWVIRSMSAKLGHRDILIRSHIYIYVRSKSQNNINYVKVAKLPQYVWCHNMWCQDSPKIRGHRGEKVKVKVK